MKRGLVARATLIERMEARLRGESFPRLIVSAVVCVAGGVAFLSSALTLWAGLDSMAVRYGLAALVGYLAFGAGIGLWLGWRRGSLDGAGDLATTDFDFGGRGDSSGGSSTTFFAGGRSGGGGASETFMVQPFAQPQPVEAADAPPPVVPVLGASTGDSGSASDVLDADADPRIWLVAIAAALAFGAVIAVAYVVYNAPLLLTEVAVDAGVMSGVYRSIRRKDEGRWLGAVWRRTLVPALIVIVCMSVAGYLLQAAVPEARSIGDVVRALN